MSEDEVSRSRRFRRERRENVPGGRAGRHVVKVTPEEESELLRRAQEARITVARLMVESALSDAGETATDRRDLAAELFSAFRLLSAISININQMAKATNATGEMPVELNGALVSVRRLADRIHGTLDEMSAP
ncbi:plasmid mobilization protein [Rhodococcus qingshengii]|uniref:plasmid mobilization protein n=1 Tax=Rhodococcus qingshengii TaxID=334542 RepID=UPI00211E02D7|nr:plasmid mobilization relaxosome protein MobC [Rhodococcus qingshengii]